MKCYTPIFLFLSLDLVMQVCRSWLDLPLGVGYCFVQCSIVTSAIWEMIPNTQKADVPVEESFGRTRPISEHRGSPARVS